MDRGVVELVVDSRNVYGNQVARLFCATNWVVGKLGVDVVFGCCGGFRHCNKLVLVDDVFFQIIKWTCNFMLSEIIRKKISIF